MGEGYHTIDLADRLEQRRPPESAIEQRGLFDVAVMGIRKMNDIARPSLRGFDLLNKLKPIYTEIEKGGIIDAQRVHLLANSTGRFSEILIHVLAYGEEDAQAKITDAEDLPLLDSAIRYPHYLQRISKHPDVDWELNELTIITPQEIATAWEKHMGQSEKIVSSANSARYGYRGEIKNPRSGITIFSLDIGPLRHVVNSNGILRVDWTAGAGRGKNKSDLRWGPNGLYPTDGLRASQTKEDSLIFEIAEDTIAFPQLLNHSGQLQDGLQFPKEVKVLENIHHYLELASRGIMQSIWHNLVLEMPSFMPVINIEELHKNYIEYPRQRLAFIDKLVDAFMVDPQKAFQLCTELGLWKASPLLTDVDENKLRIILDKLPNRLDHFKRLADNPTSYSVFDVLISAMNQALPGLNINPVKDLLVFYEDIFPSGKK